MPQERRRYAAVEAVKLRVAAPKRAEVTGYVSEIFVSVQGEGPYVGERQLFFRTAGCTETCYWCDTVSSKEERRNCVIHGEKMRVLPNPLSVADAVREVMRLAASAAPTKTVSITGGEPLEQGDFVAAVAKQLKRNGLRIYLETSGLEIEGFRKIRPFAEVVAMDIKLPSATGHPCWDVHREFLKWLVGKKGFVKIVVDATTPLDEIETAIHLMAEVDRSVPLILQPESGTYFKGDPRARKTLWQLLEQGQRIGLKSLHDVRVIPQCHKILRVR